MEISNNAMAIIILCSQLAVTEDIKPLNSAEYSKLAITLRENQMEPYDLLSLSKEELSSRLFLDINLLNRIEKLISRSANITFELDKLYRIGIKIVTRADNQYPKILKNKIKHYCPPLFYYAGNLELTKQPLIGMVGSRKIDDVDIEFTTQIVKKIINQNMGVVSGGAKGIDSTATIEALNIGGYAVEYLSNGLQQKIKKLEIIQAIRDDKLLILSETNPKSRFDVGFAMKRNKYIYGTSQATIVVKSDFNKGGTWAGAIENLNKKNNWSKIYCWNNPNYKGNIELIKKNALPIDENWKFDIESFKTYSGTKSSPIQLSIFDNEFNYDS